MSLRHRKPSARAPAAKPATPAPAPGKGIAAVRATPIAASRTPPFSIRTHAALAFAALVAIRLTAAFLTPIADCDEVFNYWEPLHFLVHAFGFQTWEYCPSFALRSYAFLYPYAIVLRAAQLLHHALSPVVPRLQIISDKIFAFYALRSAQAVASALAESSLYVALVSHFGRHVALLFLLFTASAPGMFRAAVEFLPSSFAMICLTAAHAAWLQRRFPIAVLLVAIAALLGWVFAAILALPLALYIISSRTLGPYKFAKLAVLSGAVVATIMCTVDSWHFGKFVLPPLNHVIYNVFPTPGAGSTLYGTEPWTFYFLNLFLNCTFSTVLFLIYPVVVLLHLTLNAFFPAFSHSKSTLSREVWIVSGAYLAFAVFVAQPHKEERFLAPCYPFVALAAAFTLAHANTLLRVIFTKTLAPGVASQNLIRIASLLLSCTAVAATLLTGLSRIVLQIKAYGAPLIIYTALSQTLSSALTSSNGTNVCIGAEWYRFSGSVFVPNSSHKIRFVPTAFSGLLPRPFPSPTSVPATSTWSYLYATRATQPGFNEFNRAAPDQFYDGTCDYFIDFIHAHQSSDDAEASHAARSSGRSLNVIAEAPFLDSQASPPRLRAFYIPTSWSSLHFGKYRLTHLDPHNHPKP